MNKYWSFDRDDTPQGFPLGKLIGKIREVACSSGCPTLVRRSQGYGATACRWDELLDDADEIAVSLGELERIAPGNEQWFDNLDACCLTSTQTIAFGVHDSTARAAAASRD